MKKSLEELGWVKEKYGYYSWEGCNNMDIHIYKGNITPCVNIITEDGSWPLSRDDLIAILEVMKNL